MRVPTLSEAHRAEPGSTRRNPSPKPPSRAHELRNSGKRRGRLAKTGSPQLRWALVEAAQHARRSGSPDLELYQSVRERAGAQRATLTAARKIARRCFHTLTAAEAA